MNEPSEEVIAIYCYAQTVGPDDNALKDLADALRDERAKRLKVEHKLYHLQCGSVRCSTCLIDKQALAHRQLMGETHE